MIEGNGGRLLIFAIPDRFFISSLASEVALDYGYSVPEANCATLAPEAWLLELGTSTDSELVRSLDFFRSLGNRDLFYKWDSHPKPKFYEYAAHLLKNAIATEQSVDHSDTATSTR